MTREAYERHLDTLGSWAELLPPWEIVEEAMSARERVRCPSCGKQGIVRGRVGGGCHFCGDTQRDRAMRPKQQTEPGYCEHKYRRDVETCPYCDLSETDAALAECKACLREAMDEGEDYAAAACRLQGELHQTQAIAKALLAETDLSPSEVRSRWPEDAGWLLK